VKVSGHVCRRAFVLVPISVARFETNTWAKTEKTAQKGDSRQVSQPPERRQWGFMSGGPRKGPFGEKREKRNGLASKVALKNLAHFIDI